MHNKVLFNKNQMPNLVCGAKKREEKKQIFFFLFILFDWCFFFLNDFMVALLIMKE